MDGVIWKRVVADAGTPLGMSREKGVGVSGNNTMSTGVAAGITGVVYAAAR